MFHFQFVLILHKLMYTEASQQHYSPINSGDKATTIVWTPTQGLSCTGCLTPVLTTNVKWVIKDCRNDSAFL